MERRRIVDVGERSKACAEIIEALCRSGYASDALALIDPSEGRVRTWEIETLFRHCGWEFTEAVDKMKALAQQGVPIDGVSALSAYCKGLSVEDFRTTVNSVSFREYAAYLKQSTRSGIDMIDNVASSYLVGKIQTAGNDAERESYWSTAVDLHAEGLVSDRGLARAIRMNSSLHAFEKWNAFQKGIKTESSDDLIKEIRDKIVRDMVERDAAKALSQIARAESAHSTAALATAAEQWLTNEGAAKVNEWYLSNSDHLIPAHRDAFAERFFMTALTFGERDGAQQWADQIINPQLKAECLSRLADWDRRWNPGRP